MILPIFALANAGVPVPADRLADALTSQAGIGIALWLVVGASLVGIGLAWATVRLTPARPPDGLDWPAIAGGAPLKGIGFTVAIFILSARVRRRGDTRAGQARDPRRFVVAALIGVTALHVRHRLVGRRA